MPLPLTVSCFSKIQIGFTFLVAAHLGSPGKGPLNVCVCILTCGGPPGFCIALYNEHIIIRYIVLCAEYFRHLLPKFRLWTAVVAWPVGTMDVINRLKSAVTNVLPVGNPITSEFEILGQRASGGPALLWKVYDGVQRSTKQACLLFTFLCLFLDVLRCTWSSCVIIVRKIYQQKMKYAVLLIFADCHL